MFKYLFNVVDQDRPELVEPVLEPGEPDLEEQQ